MSSSNHTLPSPDISDVMSFLREAMKEILTKLTRIEDDNRKLRQELFELKSYQKHNNNNNIVKVPSRKRDEPADLNEKSNSNNKKVRVSVDVASLPDLPACFDSLDDDCLGNVLDFVGKKCYSAFGRVNKRCNEMFCSKGYPKVTYRYGYGPIHLILQQRGRGWFSGLSEGVLHYNRRDMLEWMLADDSEDGLCLDAIEESRLDILREVFQRANTQKLEYLRDCDNGFDLCWTAARHGKLECLKFLRENKCGWNEFTWYRAKRYGHEHILEYLRNNGYPTEWQVDGDSE